MKNDIMELLEQAAYDSIITLTCKCGATCETEPDGTGYCDNCNKVINNPLLDQGFI